MDGNQFAMMASFRRDPSVKGEKLKPGTVKRILGYARPYKKDLVYFLVLNAFAAMSVVAAPLVMKAIIDKGVIPKDDGIVIWLAFGLAGLAVIDAILSLAQRWYSARIGEGLIYDLRTQV